MKTFLKVSGYSLVLFLLMHSCTPYQSLSTTGGYEDYALGNGKYKIIARGNGFSTVSRVRAIAYLRAAEVTAEHGKSFFYVLDDNLQARNQYVGNGGLVYKKIFIN